MADRDYIDIEFDELMHEFDPDKHCVSEEFERRHLQRVMCGHGNRRWECPVCRPAISKPFGS